jgi:hypothetical protein
MIMEIEEQTVPPPTATLWAAPRITRFHDRLLCFCVDLYLYDVFVSCILL